MRTGFSNLKLSDAKINKGFDNIYDLILYTVDKKYDNFLDKEKLNISVEPINIPKFKVLVKAGCENKVKQNAVSYTIELDTDYDKVEVLNSLAHEVVHISQKYNNFRNYSFEKDYSLFKEVNQNRKKKLSYSEYYREFSHEKLGTEHEAVLIQLFNCLEIENLKLAEELLFLESEYFSFDFKTFIKKAALYGNIKKETIVDLRKVIKEKLNSYLKETKEKINNDIEILGELYYFVSKNYNLYNMFEIYYRSNKN